MIPKVYWFSRKVPVVICQILMKIESSQRIFEKKNSNIKFHENPSSGSRVHPCGGGGAEGHTDIRTDMKKLIFAFRIFCERA
jgi:hypothetical protein